MGEEKVKCIICQKEFDLDPENMPGLFIQDNFICYDCEENIVCLRIHDEKYLYYMQQLKQLWIPKGKKMKKT